MKWILCRVRSIIYIVTVLFFAMGRGQYMDYLSVSQVAEKWGIKQRRIRVLCAEGRILGAYKVGSYWLIPENAEKPKDGRIKSGKYQKSSWKDCK